MNNKKVTNEMIEEMKVLQGEGLNFRQIAEKLNLSHSTAFYHLNPDKRRKKLDYSVRYFKNLPLEKRRKYYKKRTAYLREYYKTRYNTDEIFRLKEKERTRLKYKKNKEKKQ